MKNVLVTIVSIITSLFIAEFACLALNLHLPDWQIERMKMARRIGADFDVRLPEEVVLDLRDAGVNVFPYYPPIYFLNNAVQSNSTKLPSKSYYWFDVVLLSST